MSFEEWVKALQVVALPVFSKTVEALTVLKRKPDVSPAMIAAEVIRDPMMTQHLIKAVNINKKDELSQRIALAEHAVMLLGVPGTLSKLTAIKTVEKSMSPKAQAGIRALDLRTRHACAYARDWAIQRLDLNVEEVVIATALHGIAEYAMWVAAPEEVEAIIKAAKKTSKQQAEQSILGCELRELSLAMNQFWNMPPLVIDALKIQMPTSNVRAASVFLAHQLSTHNEYGWDSPTVVKDIEDIAVLRRKNTDEVATQLHRVAVNVAAKLDSDAPFPAARWLPLLPGEWPDEDVSHDSSKEVTEPDSQQMTPEEILLKINEEITHRMRDGLTLGSLLQLTMRGMQEGLLLKRVAFALLSKDRSTLQARLVVGAKNESVLKSFSMPMAEKHLFSVLMTKQQAAWINESNRQKYVSLMTTQIDKLTEGGDFYVMSLEVSGNIIGLLYADAFENELSPLNSTRYEQFKQLSNLTATAMSQLSKRRTST